MVAADAVAATGAEAYDGNLIKTLTAWVAETDRPTYCLGPVIPLQPGTSKFSQTSLEAEIKAAPGGMSENANLANISSKVIKFLGDATEKHGRNSVVYISFGTYFWYRTSIPRPFITLMSHSKVTKC